MKRKFSVCAHFNPRTRVECDFFQDHILPIHSTFQSTHSRRVRPCTTLSPDFNLNFNPRTRVECDDHPECFYGGSSPFQSTHSRRVRQGAAKSSIPQGLKQLKVRISILRGSYCQQNLQKCQKPASLRRCEFPGVCM